MSDSPRPALTCSSMSQTTRESSQGLQDSSMQGAAGVLSASESNPALSLIRLRDHIAAQDRKIAALKEMADERLEVIGKLAAQLSEYRQRDRALTSGGC